MKNFSVVRSLRSLLGRGDKDDVISARSHGVDSKVRIELFKAINGKVIQVSSYVSQPHSSDTDWESEFYIVPEGESLHEAVAVVMTMKSLTI